ncbi:hypothetical protein EXIGLDRAFT_761113 [Exidia glandulosa HHB12029]|uniref:HORMA domain-containing protein n=1 Tax=Exidia glandulosa HHB12029 TaxID=1314781 RepID=A0A165NR79_EXIGL|nr:hypothetical protein EXIGLDRAFT_761113 [Exidia glandulosa HHB12029]
MSTPESMVEDVIASLCSVIYTRLRGHRGTDIVSSDGSERPQIQVDIQTHKRQALSRLMGLWHVVLVDLVPRLEAIPKPLRVSVWDDNGQHEKYVVVKRFVTPEGASFEMRKFSDVDIPEDISTDEAAFLYGYVFSPAPLVTNAELYYEPTARTFWIVEHNRANFRYGVSVRNAAPVLDFGLYPRRSESAATSLNNATNRHASMYFPTD